MAAGRGRIGPFYAARGRVNRGRIIISQSAAAAYYAGSPPCCPSLDTHALNARLLRSARIPSRKMRMRWPRI